MTMFSYIQIIGQSTDAYKGYVDYSISKDKLSITLVRGMRKIKRIIIPISKITDINVGIFYGEDKISFIYDSKQFVFLNTGYGETQYFKDHFLRAVNAYQHTVSF